MNIAQTNEESHCRMPTKCQSVFLLCCILVVSSYTLVIRNGDKPTNDIPEGLQDGGHSEVNDGMSTNLQRQRHMTLQRWCERLKRPCPPLKSVDPFDDKNRRILIVPEINFTICVNGKAGSTFWRGEVSRKYNGDFQFKFAQPLLKKAKDGFTNIIVVRHPLYRIYSAYNDRVIRRFGTYEQVLGGHPYILERFLSKYSLNKTDCYIDFTFEQYVRLILYEMGFEEQIQMELHRMPFYARCHPCEFNYDIIVKVETLKTDVQLVIRLLKKKGIDVKFDMNNLERNYIRDKCRRFNPYKEIIPPRCYNDDSFIKGNLQALWNQGYTPKYGFTFNAFMELPKYLWRKRCVSLVKAVVSDPKKRSAVSAFSKNSARKALLNLPKPLLDKLIKSYTFDLKMFGYDVEDFVGTSSLLQQ